MKKWTPLLIVILVGTSSICLIIIQLLGIKSTVNTENNLFKLNIAEAIGNINKRLEYYEHANTFNNLSYFSIEVDPLDSLIYEEIECKGIKTTVVYGICSAKELIYINDSAYKNELLTSDLKYQLYPSNCLGGKNNKIILYFPDKEEIIYKKNVWFIVFSLLFILIILGVFVYLFKTIYVQRKLSELKNDFVNNLTHEIKTPISTVSLVLEMLSDEGTFSDKEIQKQYIGIIKDENKRLQTLTEQILLMAKIEEKGLKIHYEALDIHNLISSCAETMKFSVEKKGGKLFTHLCAKDTLIYCDKMHIFNIIQNLIDNACKYSGNKPVVEISTYNLFKGIEITVKDNGIGIAKNERNIIFEKFYRVSTGNIHNVKGYGIGLSYVKQIVDLHKGSIRIESELNKGSSFIIFLPKGGV